MPSATILGGTGTIGRAAARRLLAAGWDVTVTGRTPSHLPADVDARFVTAHRDEPRDLARVVHADLLVDCLCYTAAQARALLPLLTDVGSTVMISSKAVYVDADGNHVNSDVTPDFGGPVTEAQPTMAPREDVEYRSRDGYGANKVAAEQVLLDSGHPVTVLRPSKVHGDGTPNPGEWVFVKRVLDNRKVVVLAHGGRGVDHTSAAANIAALIETVARLPGTRVLNSADPDAPSALAISRIVAAHLGHEWREVLLDDQAPPDLGRHPWDRIPPIRLDMTAAAALGYRPAGDYAATVTAELDWLMSDSRFRFIETGLYSIDYASEDAYLATR